MNIYVETNFVLELTFEQEQHSSCEKIFQLCGTELATLILPAYCLAELSEKLIGQRPSYVTDDHLILIEEYER